MHRPLTLIFGPPDLVEVMRDRSLVLAIDFYQSGLPRTVMSEPAIRAALPALLQFFAGRVRVSAEEVRVALAAQGIDMVALAGPKP